MLAVALVLVVTPHRRPAAVHRLVAPRRTGHRRVTGHGRRRRRQRQRLIAIPVRAIGVGAVLNGYRAITDHARRPLHLRI